MKKWFLLFFTTVSLCSMGSCYKPGKIERDIIDNIAQAQLSTFLKNGAKIEQKIVSQNFAHVMQIPNCWAILWNLTNLEINTDSLNAEQIFELKEIFLDLHKLPYLTDFTSDNTELNQLFEQRKNVLTENCKKFKELLVYPGKYNVIDLSYQALTTLQGLSEAIVQWPRFSTDNYLVGFEDKPISEIENLKLKLNNNALDIAEFSHLISLNKLCFVSFFNNKSEDIKIAIALDKYIFPLIDAIKSLTVLQIKKESCPPSDPYGETDDIHNIRIRIHKRLKKNKTLRELLEKKS